VKVKLYYNGQQFDVATTDGAPTARVDIACPHCGAPPPLRVQGTGRRIEGHDVYSADVFAACCSKPIGVVRAQMDTLFGLDEDERVLHHGRCRVY
jgi:hypothetical protein